MLKSLLILTVVGSSVIGQGLGPGPVPGEGEVQQEKKQARRNLPGYPFLPIYIPYQQVVEVHHVVMLQPPNCVPSVPLVPGPGGTIPVQPQTPVTPAPTPTPGIENRMGGGTTTTAPAMKRPSRCVWAIVACCSPDSNSIRYSCFELLGCPGAFWGVNPCEGKVVQAAANTALNFYMTGGEEPPAPDANNL